MWRYLVFSGNFPSQQDLLSRILSHVSGLFFCIPNTHPYTTTHQHFLSLFRLNHNKELINDYLKWEAKFPLATTLGHTLHLHGHNGIWQASWFRMGTPFEVSCSKKPDLHPGPGLTVSTNRCSPTRRNGFSIWKWIMCALAPSRIFLALACLGKKKKKKNMNSDLHSGPWRFIGEGPTPLNYTYSFPALTVTE